MLGILLIDKQPGLTSHDVVNRLRRKLEIRRIGHAGTLDPLATGLLLVAVGPATRFLQYLPLEPKVYEAEILFGVATTTQDAEGEITSEVTVPANLKQLIEEKVADLTGPIKQLPPMYSAIKKAGKPLYSYARKGENVEREPRSVFIVSVDILEVGETVAKVRIVCSGGTYIRTWAHDLGLAVGCGAHLKFLRRTKIGAFDLGDAVLLDDAEQSNLISLGDALKPALPLVELNEVESKAIREGQAVGAGRKTYPSPVALVETKTGLVFGIARYDEGRLFPECVIPIEATLGNV